MNFSSIKFFFVKKANVSNVMDDNLKTISVKAIMITVLTSPHQGEDSITCKKRTELVPYST